MPPETSGLEAQLGFRGRQIVASIIVAAAVAAATALVSAALLARAEVADARDNAEAIGSQLFAQASLVIRQHPMEELRAALASDESLRSHADAVIGSAPRILYLAISDVDGLAIFHSDPERQELPLEPEGSLREFSRRTALGQLWALSRAQGGLIFDQEFAVEGDESYGAVQVAVSAVLLKRDLLRSVTVNTLLATTVVLIAFIVSFYLANRLLAPLAALRDQLERLDVGKDQPPLELRTKEDVGRVAEFFDSLSKRLATDHRLDSAGLSLTTLVTGLNEAVIVLAEDLTILSLNDSASRLLDAEAVPGRQLDEILPAAHPVRQVVDEALERGRSDAIQPVPVPGEQEPVSYLLGANLLSESDRTSGVLVTARNLEGLSRVASQLSYAQKLASLGRLTSGVSHELRNPLNAMTMHLAILRKKIAARSSEAGHHVDVLEEELGRLGRVVMGFLEFSRPEEIELHRLDVDAVILTAIGRVRHLADANGIAVNFRAEAQLPQVIANFHLLEQAFINLLTNSCEAMPDGGRIDVRANQSDGQVTLVIEDTGPGIPPEKLPQVFNLYFTTKESGSGIGLSLVYRIVQLHGGEIRDRIRAWPRNARYNYTTGRVPVMSFVRNNWCGAFCLVLALSALTASGCRVFRRAPIERPPAVEEVPPQTEASGPEEMEAVESDDAALEPGEGEPIVPDETESDVPVELEVTDQVKAEVEAPEQPEPVAPPQPEQTPQPTPKTAEQPPDEKTEPPEPRLIPGEDEEVSLESIRSDLARAERLSDVLADRALSAELRTQVESGRAFLGDARDAMEAQDRKRAAVLLDKSLGLLEDAEYNSRP